MPLIGALHGRARMRKARLSRLRLVALLLLAISVLALSHMALLDAYEVTRRESLSALAIAISIAAPFVLCVAPLLAGFLIDRFGVKTVVGLALVGWCAIVAAAPVFVPPLAFRLGSPLLTYLLAGVVLTGALVAMRRALPDRRRALAVAIVSLAYAYARHPVGLFTYVFAPPDPDDPTSWQYPMFALATAGAAITVLWLLAFREVEPATRLDLRASKEPGMWRGDVAAAVRRPGLWILLLIHFCVGIVYSRPSFPSWSLDKLRVGVVGADALLPVVLVPAAFIAAAVWSDRRWRRTRSFTEARVPPLLIGFALSAIVSATAMALPREHAYPIVAQALALGVLRSADFLTVDLAPRETAGSFIGLVLAAELVGSLLIVPVLMQPATTIGELSALVAVVAILGAIATFVLAPRLRPAAD